MRNKIKPKLILIILVCTRLLGICQDGPKQANKDYIINYEKINFHFKDSLYPVTIFIEPNGYFYFLEGFVESAHPGESAFRRLNNKSKTFDYKDKFIKKSDSIVKLSSLFPILIRNDSSIINHYLSKYHPSLFFYELRYSYILRNLNEPKIFDNKDLRSIRVILPEEEFGVPYKYISIRLDFGNNILIYTKGKFDSNSNFKIVQKDSCIVSAKDVDMLNKLLQEINFKKETYFIEVGPDIYPRYLLEYKTKNEYYAFARQFSSRDKKDKDLNKFMHSLISVLSEDLKINWL